MLYYKALQQGLSRLPAADPEVRTRLTKALAEQGLASLYSRLQAVDPVAAGRIHPHDPQRIQRALEVYELSGRPMTELYREMEAEKWRFRTLKLVVTPQDRSILHQRIPAALS